MPFVHNDYYQRLLIRQLPAGGRTALDVGCGTGRFARRLARRGYDVDAIDQSAETLATARALTAQIWAAGTIHWQQADITTVDLPDKHYDFISCLASIHHVPFETVGRLRDALTHDGVLAILGLYNEETASDWLLSLAAVPVNAAARLTMAISDKLQPTWENHVQRQVSAPTMPPSMTLAQIRTAAAEELPGCTIHRLLFWRYLLVYRKTT
ncbi:class I SAM-dependent methyltransferase [Actinopolymorpha sp. B11F2]|uniref:class I SAM-dependent methyltransferase n=1 Tax=Actinopolymorpha sp. B11F2 TaxID=3160862 RepID=UPI0032E39978